MKLSIVTTLYKSASSVPEFLRRMSAEAGKISQDHEIIIVDDGSPDKSLSLALHVLKDDRRIKIIELSKNFGHHKAMMTGIEHARGELVFLIDVDLEEPPELLSLFHEELRRGTWDVVYGYQQERKGGFVEKYAGGLVWKLLALCLPITLPPNHSTARLMSAQYAAALVRHKEHKTAIGGLWVITGFAQKGLPFTKGSRAVSSYTLASRTAMLLDSITSFSELPLYAVFGLGSVILAISGVFGLSLVALRLFGRVLSGWVSIMTSIWFLGGLAIFSIGVVGLYVSRIFIETKQRPYTIIKKIHESR